MNASIRVKPAPSRRNDPRSGLQDVQSETTATSPTPSRSRSAAFAARRSSRYAAVGAPLHGPRPEPGAEPLVPVGRHRVAAGSDPRPDRHREVDGPGAERGSHEPDRLEGDAGSLPSRVNEAERARAPVDEEDRQAVGDRDRQQQVRPVAHHAVGLGERAVRGLGAVDPHDRAGVHLPDAPHPRRIGTQGGEQLAAPGQICRAARDPCRPPGRARCPALAPGAGRGISANRASFAGCPRVTVSLQSAAMVLAVFYALLQLLFLSGLGFVLSRLRGWPRELFHGFNRFVASVALPLSFFTSIARTDPGQPALELDLSDRCGGVDPARARPLGAGVRSSRLLPRRPAHGHGPFHLRQQRLPAARPDGDPAAVAARDVGAVRLLRGPTVHRDLPHGVQPDAVDGRQLAGHRLREAPARRTHHPAVRRDRRRPPRGRPRAAAAAARPGPAVLPRVPGPRESRRDHDAARHDRTRRDDRRARLRAGHPPRPLRHGGRGVRRALRAVPGGLPRRVLPAAEAARLHARRRSGRSSC